MLGSGFKRGAALSLFIILFIFVSAGLAVGYVSMNLPPGNDFGRFRQESALTADFNTTFDIPFPIGPGETTMTANVTQGGNNYGEQTIALRPLLERYGVIYQGKYVYRPNFFEYDVTLTGKNVTYVGVPFNYTIRQTRVPPVGVGNRLWNIQSRHITDSTGEGTTLKSKYCSGPWDFEGEGFGEGYLCDASKTTCGTEEDGGDDDGEIPCYEIGEVCNVNSDCCSGNCEDGICRQRDDCPAGTYPCESRCCNYGDYCCEGKRPGQWVCCSDGCADGGGCEYVRAEGAGDQLPEGSNILLSASFGSGGILSFATGSPVTIQKLTWDPNSTAELNYETILYYEDRDSKDIPNEPGTSISADSLYCQTSHSWFFQTHIYPTITRTSSLRVYPDSGARVYLDRAEGNGWVTVKNITCLNGCESNPDLYSSGCKWTGVSFEKNNWYRLRIYLFNNPGGYCNKKLPPSGNPMGIKIVDEGNYYQSLLSEFGGESVVVNSEPPGQTRTFNGSSTISANEGLKEIVDVSAFSVDYVVTSSDPNVTLTMRKVCGNAMYDSNKYTDRYGWIIDRTLKTWSWETDGNDRISKPNQVPPFDASSVNGDGRNLFRPDAKNIGGIYKCLDVWPRWADDCAEGNRYFDDTHDEYCCRKTDVELDGDAGIIKIKNYESFYSYIINYLPAKGSKLCAYTEKFGQETPVNYLSEFKNTYCIEGDLNKCCFCTRDFGCTLECLNKENTSGGFFPPPFDMSGPGWEVVNLSFGVAPSDPNVQFTFTGNSRSGWNLEAAFTGTGVQTLYRNHTIPLNLYDDFGLLTPAATGTYNVDITLNYGAGKYLSKTGTFEVVQCLRPGEEDRGYYDGQAYPGTKNVGVCKPGKRTCGSDYAWFYATKYDEPVYPKSGYETFADCNGLDDDCNGIVDDIGGFDNIIGEFIASLGKKKPKQITRCGCFAGSDPSPEICNNIDDDCDGIIDNVMKVITVNRCDQIMIACEEEGGPYTWCRQFYNSSNCTMVNVTFGMPGRITVNTCTESVIKCMGNKRYNNQTDQYEPFTYDDCKHLYQGSDCVMEEREVKALNNTCYCSGGLDTDPSLITETCNGVDDDCNGIIDDVEGADTCVCAFAEIEDVVYYRSLGDYSCNGVDSDCNGVIDDSAALCACRGRSQEEVTEIMLGGRDICDGVDNDCDGLVDEGFSNLGKACGYGVCSGGSYVCNVYGDGEVCNTTVRPEQTYLGNAFDFRTPEACDLRDNDCDGSIDEEDCLCTPSDVGVSRICGYESGVYYNDEGEIDVICDEVMTQISGLISWAEAPGNVFYRRLVTLSNGNNFDLQNYPAHIVLDTGGLVSQDKLRPDGGDFRIRERGKQEHMDWLNSETFTSDQNGIWFRVDIPGNSEKDYYIYYGDPSATYNIPGETNVLGLPKLRETLLLCHFDDTLVCEGNVIASRSGGISYPDGKYQKGLALSSGGFLSYPTSENINKERGSLGLWVKPGNLSGDNYLFYLEDTGGNPQFALHFDSSGTYFEVHGSGDTRTAVGSPPGTEWSRMAVTWDVLYGIKLYINGVLEDSVVGSWGMNDLGMDMYVGSMGSENQIKGDIDEFAVYSNVLSGGEVKRDARTFGVDASIGPEESLNQTTTLTTAKDIYLKCTQFLSNVTQTLTNESIMYTILSLCDSVRICNKTFPVNSASICMIGTQTCSGGHWSECTGVLPGTEVCNNIDDDCNGIVDDVANPETCACSYGGQPGDEECNAIDDDCNEVIDDVMGGDSKESTHCGCFGELVNITQKVTEPEKPACNGIDDNCNGMVDEGLPACACAYTVFNSETDNLTSSKQPEDCDRIDDDCNGIADDPFMEGGLAVGSDNYLGAGCGPDNSMCSGGSYVCSKDGTQTVCDTMSEDGLTGSDLRMPERCNAIDDDCNVIIDDVWGDDSGDYCQCYQGIPESEEVCDGRDNDCDGTIDNVENTRQCACFTDLILNTTNAYTISADITSIKASAETCNNIDDNCNRKIDDGLEGICFCSGGFSGNPNFRPEMCNGADDDCNGVIDDVDFPEMCGCYEGSHSRGEVPETCDTIDNDCNGLIDEGWTELGSACGFGLCLGGEYECTPDGSSVICSTIGGSENQATEEVCDGKDNDCDLVVDESCPCTHGENKTCGMDEGECRYGYQACINGQWSNCIGGKGPAIEVCDGKDNDCDGTIDNVGGGTTEKSSKCSCYGGADEEDEICDGVDNDCDGTIDNVYGGDSVVASKCACYNNLAAAKTNIEVCNAIDDDCDGTIDNVWGEISKEKTKCGCFGGEPKTNEVCNEIDDDCDGTIDNSWPNVGEICGSGVCTGVYVCKEDGMSVVCNGGSPSPEVSDGRDNDCDGIIDNVKAGPPPVCGNGACEGGETQENCPQDCGEGIIPPAVQGTWLFVFVAIIIIIVIIGLALTFLK